MSMEPIYTCNLCREVKKQNDLKGIYFKPDERGSFYLCDARDTAGTHICLGCVTQLKKILDGEKK